MQYNNKLIFVMLYASIIRAPGDTVSTTIEQTKAATSTTQTSYAAISNISIQEEIKTIPHTIAEEAKRRHIECLTRSAEITAYYRAEQKARKNLDDDQINEWKIIEKLTREYIKGKKEYMFAQEQKNITKNEEEQERRVLLSAFNIKKSEIIAQKQQADEAAIMRERTAFSKTELQYMNNQYLAIRLKNLYPYTMQSLLYPQQIFTALSGLHVLCGLNNNLDKIPDYQCRTHQSIVEIQYPKRTKGHYILEPVGFLEQSVHTSDNEQSTEPEALLLMRIRAETPDEVPADYDFFDPAEEKVLNFIFAYQMKKPYDQFTPACHIKVSHHFLSRDNGDYIHAPVDKAEIKNIASSKKTVMAKFFRDYNITLQCNSADNDLNHHLTQIQSQDTNHHNALDISEMPAETVRVYSLS